MLQERQMDDQSCRVGAVRNIAFVAFPEVELIDVCGPFDAFAYANRCFLLTEKVDGPVYQLAVIAPQAGPLRTSSGLQIVAHHAYSEFAEPIDTLIVAGGDEGVVKACADAALIAWVKETAKGVRRVASVCTGAFLLAASGLLEGRRVTTHWGYCNQLASAYPSICVDADRIFVRGGHIYTSGGITAGIDLALALVEEDLGRDIARFVARLMVVFLRRPGSQSQFSTYLGSETDNRRDIREFRARALNQLDAGLSREAFSSLSVTAHNGRNLRELQTWILAHPEDDLSIEALAERVAMSPRNFARLFVQETGMTPAKFVEQARLDTARFELEQTTLPVEAIAEHCGFGDPERMRRTFQRVLRVSPQNYRARFRSSLLN